MNTVFSAFPLIYNYSLMLRISKKMRSDFTRGSGIAVTTFAEKSVAWFDLCGLFCFMQLFGKSRKLKVKRVLKLKKRNEKSE